MSLVGNIWFEILRLKENASKTKQAFFMQITFTIFSIPFFCPDGTFIKSSTCLTKKLDYELSKQVSTYSSWPWIRWHLRPWLTRTPLAKRGGTSFLLLKVGGDHGDKVLFDEIIMLMLCDFLSISYSWLLSIKNLTYLT